MKKRKSNIHVLPVFGIGFLLSAALIAGLLFCFGWIVQQNDMRGGVLLALLMIPLVSGSVFYALFVQRKLRMKGLFCGLLCGAILSVAYFLFAAISLQFRVMPILWLLIPVGVLGAVVSGIFSANFFRN